MYRFSAKALGELFKQGKISAKEIAQYTLQRTLKHDDKLGAFLSVFSERILSQAEKLDKKRADGKPLGKLAGIPIALKDNIHLEGEISTCGSKFLSNYRAVFDASVVQFMQQEDALFIGKTNMDEFAMGSSTENSAYKLTKNPWDLNCTPGGSSGGSAAAVAARLCPLSLGSDTGGSIRQPAALCGIVGFKPTYGRVSRSGLVAFGSSLDQIGPFATSVEDIALIMEVIGKHSKEDSTSLPIPEEPYLKKLDLAAKGRKIGVPWKLLEELAPDAKENFMQALKAFEGLGMSVVDVDLSLLKQSIAVYYILATAEASTNLARFDGIRYGQRSSRAQTLEEVYEFSKEEGFGPEVKQRILLGTYVLSSGYQNAYYKKAQKVRALIIRQMQKAFEACDVIAMPTSPFPAFPVGSIQDPLQMYLLDIYTICANLAGLPAINVPSGFNKDQKPFGLQLVGPQMQDAKVLAFAHLFESMTKFSSKIPPLFDDEVKQ